MKRHVLAYLALSVACLMTSADVIIIQQSGMGYIPEDAVCSPGDTIRFLWGNGNHSVTTGADCEYGPSNGFDFDEPLTVANPVVDIEIPVEIDETLIIDYYCDVQLHCADHDMFATITVVPPKCNPGDFNCDNSVGGADLGLLLSAWGTFNPLYDLNDNGAIDGGDLGIFLSLWSG
jgi:plastocyanin